MKKDIWNIGVLLYKTVSGKFPFEDKTIIATCIKIINVVYIDLDVEFSGLSNPLIRKLLTKESENRISIEEFENEIDRINSNLYIKVYSTFNVDDEEEERGEEDVKFIAGDKESLIRITENWKRITKTKGVGYSHCYLNVRMIKGIHHFIFKILHGYKNIIFFGCTSNNEYDGKELCYDESSCSIGLKSDYSKLFGYNGNKMIDGKFDDIFGKKGIEYEVIFNMNENTMSIKQGKKKEILLFTNIKPPVYPFVSFIIEDDSVSLIKYWKE